MMLLTHEQHETRATRRAFTLVEMLVVVGIIVIVLSIAIPSLSGLTRGAQEETARTMLRSLLASARAEAASTGRPVGVRFEQDAEGQTWAVVVVEAPPYMQVDSHWLTLAAPQGREAVRLPRGVELAAGSMPVKDASLANLVDALNSTTFTVLFEPDGKLSLRTVRVGQRRLPEADPEGTPFGKRDDTDTIFEDPIGITTNYGPNPRQRGYLPQNTWLLRGDKVRFPDGSKPFNPESTEASLWIYDQNRRKDAGATAVSGYLVPNAANLFVRINPYTGRME